MKLTQRQREAVDSPRYSEALRQAIQEFAKLPRADAQFEIRYLEVLFTERDPDSEVRDCDDRRT